MKALSLYQPWASAIMMGLKKNETRGVRWNTLNCDVAICASKRTFDQTCLAVARQHAIPLTTMKFGAVLCVVHMTNPQSSALYPAATMSEIERSLGDYSPGRWIYECVNLRALSEPVPVIGRQGLFNLPPDVEAKVREQLTAKSSAA